MKIRLDFVSNSSSSSYIVVYEVRNTDEFWEWLKEEYGNVGVTAFANRVVQGNQLGEEGTSIINEAIQDQHENAEYYIEYNGEEDFLGRPINGPTEMFSPEQNKFYTWDEFDSEYTAFENYITSDAEKAGLFKPIIKGGSLVEN